MSHSEPTRPPQPVVPEIPTETQPEPETLSEEDEKALETFEDEGGRAE
jgi:hypothetical protein